MKSVFAVILCFLSLHSSAKAAPAKPAFEGCWTGSAEIARFNNGIVRENASCNLFALKIRQVASATFAYEASCLRPAKPESPLNFSFKRAGDTALKDGQLIYHFFNFDAETGFDTRIRWVQNDRLEYTYVRNNDELTGITITSQPLQRTGSCPL
jgi:hypothetical protein